MIVRSNAFENIWNIIVSIFAGIATIFITLDIVFKIRPTTQITIVDWLVTFIFVLDIIINLANSRINRTDQISGRLLGAKRYLKYWFILDLIAAIPFLIFLSSPFFGLFRLIKLIKVAFFMRRIRRKEIQYAYPLTFTFFIYWIILSAHLLSCGWLYIRGIDASLDNNTNYIRSLYWTVTTLTTVGYGDITPQNNTQIIYTIFLQILALGLIGYLIGKIVSILSKRNPAKAHYMENIEMLTALNHYRDIPPELLRRINDYYIYLWKKRLGYNESHFLESLPENLRIEVALYLKNNVLERIPLFKGANTKFIKEIAMHLTPTVLTPGDYVFRAGEAGCQMFFVVHGELITLSKNEDKILSTITDGDFFGEIALFKNKPRTATIKAISYCDIYELDKKQFDIVISKYPKIASQIEEKVIQREERHPV